MLRAAGHHDDRDVLLDRYNEQLVADPSAVFGASLLADVTARRSFIPP
jgi:hypothetical protein